MNGRAKRGGVRGILGRVVIGPLFAVALLVTEPAAQAVVSATPTPGTPPYTVTGDETTDVSPSLTLDPSVVPDEQVLALGQQEAGEQSALADGAAPLHAGRVR